MRKSVRFWLNLDRRSPPRLVASLALVVGFSSPSAFAQEQPFAELRDQPKVTTQDEGLKDIGSTAETGSGEVGKRQTAKPFGDAGRIENRIQNRVQNRLRNRVDETFDATNSTASSFEVANEKYRDSAGRQR